MSDYQTLEKLYRSRQTMLEMLIDRKYDEDFLTEFYLNKTFNEFTKMYKENNIDINVKNHIKKKICSVIFSDPYIKIKKDEFLTIIDNLKDTMDMNEIDAGFTYNLIIITMEKLPHQVIKLITDINSKDNDDDYEKNIKIEHFIYNEIIFNKTKHKLVPKHIPLTSEESERMLEQYKISRKELPKIIVTSTPKKDPDVIAKYFGLEPGDIVRIEDNNETSGIYINYRVAI